MKRIFYLLFVSQIAFAFLHRSHFPKRSSISSAAATQDCTTAKQTILVTYRSDKNDEILHKIASTLKCSINFLSSPNDIQGLKPSSATLVALDAASVTSAEAASALQAHSNLVFIMHEDMDPARLNAISQGVDIARNACHYDLFSRKDQAANTSTRLRKLLERLQTNTVYDEQDTLLDAGEWSHFVSLTFPSIDKGLSKLPALRIGADALELRVDLLSDISIPSLHRQIALLRDSCPLPIVFTVRSVGQIGKFPKDSKRIFDLLREGLRAGAEWVDVEACWPQDQTNSFTDLAKSSCYKYTSRLLGSLHVTVPQTRAEVDSLFEACDLNGRADVLKTVTGAANQADCELIHESGGSRSKPYIGVCLGADGSYSRVLNRRFTPVTHECMAVAAPGQLTVKQLMDQRISAGLLKPKNFFLYGTPISQSLSPAMHNAAFSALALPHVYGLNEQADVTAYQSQLQDPSFGGASVTIPHKEAIMPFLDEIRGAAREIGAVNTIVVETGLRDKKRRLVGYNTDWIGIQRPVLSKLRASGVEWTGGMGLVVGAGGTARAACYAVKSLGLKLLVTNRSPEKGRELAEMFGGTFVSLDELAALGNSSLRVIISTIPSAAGFTVPPVLLVSKPVILDVVYKPAKTALMQQALDANCPLVQGATMLLTQGMEQFELWNMRRAPFVEMDAAIFAGAERL